MDISFDLLINALVSGLLLGGFYAALSLGVSISFGMLDIVNIAHPTVVILGAYFAWWLNENYGLDPMVAGIVMSPLFFLMGILIYRIYYDRFEKEGGDSLRGLAFFFGILFIIEMILILLFGVDYRNVNVSYTDATIKFGLLNVPYRLLIPFVFSVSLLLIIRWAFKKTYFGRAVSAVAQDPLALQLMGVNHIKVKGYAFGLSLVTAGIGGALLIIIQSVQPAAGREYIGLVFAICVLGGMGNLMGTLFGAMILGVAESFTATFAGPSWSPAVSFGLLLLTLAFRPQGIFGK
ncbi:MAG: branched-chain amino acid ABC transporter permease [Betaproteobacteria bacterium]|jgi:branched-chain amino acid transport system permease protein